MHPALPDWFKKLGGGEKITIDPSVVEKFERKLLGKHNLENIAAAFEVSKILDIDQEETKSAIANFKPLPHRLNYLGKKSGIDYFDDTFSTNIEPTIAAIEAINKNLILIVGGSDKGLDFSLLGKKIKETEKIKGLVVIGVVAEKILESVKGFKGKILTGASNIDEIINQAKSLAEADDAILFSPATASFGMFKNEFDRGEQFVNAVKEIQ